ncbi:MAG: hypothetical protein WCF16_02175 [Alphaproteobacteria bacterium]
MTDAELAANLKAPSRSVPRNVATADVKKYLFLNDLYLPLRAGAQAGAQSAIFATAALDTFQSFEMTDPAVAAKVAGILDLLAADSILTADHKAAILDLGQRRVSRAEEIGLNPEFVIEGRVAQMRT